MGDLPFSSLAHRAFEHHAPLRARVLAEILEMLRNLVGQEGCRNETREFTELSSLPFPLSLTFHFSFSLHPFAAFLLLRSPVLVQY